jgi:DNA-binding LacI/PurR family transcriptional regulator
VVTMKEIGKAVGVSQAAVSYAFNHPSRLSEQRREEILAKAAELGYAAPAKAGRRGDNASVGAVGLMVMDTLSYAFDDASNVLLIKGLVEVGELANVALTLLPFEYIEHIRVPSDIVPTWVGLIDGLVIHSLPEQDPVIESLVDLIPVVIIDSPYIQDVPFVGIKDRQAAYTAMSHLLDLGHRKIGILVDRLSPDGFRGYASAERAERAVDRVARERIAGYMRALSEHRVETSDIPIYEASGFDHGSAVLAAEHIIDERDLTAIMATTDTLAMAALDVCADRHITVPGEISIVGFDDAPGAARAGLTTIRQPMIDKGRYAARLLLERVRGGNRQQVILPTELVVRSSSAAPRR